MDGKAVINLDGMLFQCKFISSNNQQMTHDIRRIMTENAFHSPDLRQPVVMAEDESNSGPRISSVLQIVLTENENDSGHRITLIILVVGIQNLQAWLELLEGDEL